ncbi:MAG: type II toxin-antitoxin system death-on-curing family toxin, partial [Rhizobiales bacterium]|nr:type II toxin-antitoxin system death-on-curing family toxin [Hyphomicrobiales bacterium]
LAKNHAFVDGNKRVSLVVTELFVALNGLQIVASDEEILFKWLALAEGQVDEASLAQWIHERLKPSS